MQRGHKDRNISLSPIYKLTRKDFKNVFISPYIKEVNYLEEQSKSCERMGIVRQNILRIIALLSTNEDIDIRLTDMKSISSFTNRTFNVGSYLRRHFHDHMKNARLCADTAAKDKYRLACLLITRVTSSKVNGCSLTLVHIYPGT